MAKTDKKLITQVAADLADRDGLDKVTLKDLAQTLNIRSPSLYNHISGLDEVRASIMLYGWAQLGTIIARSTVGKSKDDAIRAMCKSYRDYTMAHPGVFEAMMWYNQSSSQEATQATSELSQLVALVLAGYNLDKKKNIHASRMFRSFLQGFCSIVNNNGFADHTPIQESFDFAVEILIKGLDSLESL